jgi:hypothetical protein
MNRTGAVQCRVCLESKPKDEMRKTSRGRTIRHCRACVVKFRCIKCGEVKEAKHFKTHAGNRQFFFDDGEEQKISLCYQCDYKVNKARYRRYDKRVREGRTIRHLIMSNIQRWKVRCRNEGWKFDVSLDYLVKLWEDQKGICFYTGEPLLLDRGRSKWMSGSLDRVDASRGYEIGNVVWTSRLVNTSKGQRTAKEFVTFCQKVVDHMKDRI